SFLLPARFSFFPYTTLFRSQRAVGIAAPERLVIGGEHVEVLFARLVVARDAMLHDVAHDLGGDPASETDVVRRGLQHGECPPCRSEEHTSELQSRENLVCRL